MRNLSNLYFFMNDKQWKLTFFSIYLWLCSRYRKSLIWKNKEIINYCNCLKQADIKPLEITAEKFLNHHKQVLVITQNQTIQIKLINSIKVK